MSRFLFCWELGDRQAHLLRTLPLGLELRDMGHQVLFAVHDVQAGTGELSRHGLAFVQAPQAHDTRVSGPIQDRCYADELVRAGFGDRVSLLGLVEAWQGLFSLFHPDALVIDNGPSALVAARVSDLPRLVLGDGYTLPATLGAAMGGGQRAVRLHSSERRVAETVAGVMRLGVAGRPPARTQLFDPAECMLLTAPALDPFGPRPGMVYEGAHVRTDVGLPMSWKEAGPRVLLHLPEPALAQYAAGIAPLADADVIGWSVGLRSRFVELQQACPSVRWVGSTVCLDTVLADAELCIHDGMHGLLSACLAAGVPQIVVPAGGSSLAHAVCAAREDAVAIVPRPHVEERLALHVEHALRGRAMRQSASAWRLRHAQAGGVGVQVRLLSRALSLPVDPSEGAPRGAGRSGTAGRAAATGRDAAGIREGWLRSFKSPPTAHRS